MIPNLPLPPLEAATVSASNNAAVEVSLTASKATTTPDSSYSAAAMGPRPGFQDATVLLASACSELQPGQMVAVPEFTLMDSMAAVKIMDARMDSGMELPASELPESDRLDNSSPTTSTADFDPFQPLDVADVLWIMDRLLACEAAWHQGSGLSQTLYTCLYFHNIKLLSHKHPRFQTSSQSTKETDTSASNTQVTGSSAAKQQPPLELVYKVLRAFLLATVKTIDIAWSELTSKQHLQDGEDYSAEKNGLSLLETTDTGYVIVELEDALEWLQSQTTALANEQIESLRVRLNFRKQMLYAVRLLQTPAEAAPIDVVMHTKFARRHWALLCPISNAEVANETQSESQEPTRHSNSDATTGLVLHLPNRNAAPSAASLSAFDLAYNRRLAWCQALRPISLPSPDETWTVMDDILEELQDVIRVLQHPSFLSWKTFFTHRAIKYQASQPLSATPYIRSLFQTAVCDRNMIASRLSLEWMAETFFQEVALIDPLLLRRASRIGRNNVEGISHTLWNASPPLGQRVHYFMQRVAGQLVQYLCTLSQNRARCKRTMASRLYREWVSISEEASAIGRELEACLAPGERYMPDSLFAAAQYLALEVMSQITFSGFELDLYSRGTDRESMWWLASRIQMEQKIVCGDLRDELSKWLEHCSPDSRPRKYAATILYLSRQNLLARALEQLAISTIFLMHLSERLEKGTAERTKPRSWPLSPEDDSAGLELAKTVFASRTKWARSTAARRNDADGRMEEHEADDVLWQEYVAFRGELDATDASSLSKITIDRLDEAIMHLENLASTFAAAEKKHELGAQGMSDLATSLLETARHNRITLETVSQGDGACTPSKDDSESSLSQETQQSRHEWVFEHPWLPKWIVIR
ncbi:uncharacterized protein UBRO_16816 [Ustilago bromivora]|uniref:Mak10-domain-containing protein n=1 Tax=Ustilago bromivora TaxID=307758 RepID=A0A1K0H1Z8_9BASI|nr:uncharacterized protein UBRO_16816 [Ustilago bromivora]